MPRIVEAVHGVVDGIVAGLGYEVLDIEYVKKPSGWHLTIVIDKEGGVGIGDCEAVHRAVDEPLDGLDEMFPEGYTLNVSSPGLDRPLRNEKDFRRNLGKKIEVKFYAPEDGQKVVEGVLASFTDKQFVIKTEKGEKTVEKSKTARVAPAIDWKSLTQKGEEVK